MINYDPLWETMKAKGFTKYKLMRYHQVVKGTLDRLSKNRPVTTTTLDDFCRILECEISDIVRYVPDEKKEN